MDLKALKAAHEAKAKEVKAVLDKAKAEKREVSEDELVALETGTGELNALQAQVDRAERLAAIETSTVATVTKYQTVEPRISHPDGAATFSGNTAVTSGLRERVLEDRARGFSGLGEFALAVKARQDGTATDERLKSIMAAAGTGMQQGVAADGGVLVPPSFSQTIYDGLRQDSASLTALCDTVTIPYGIESITYPMVRETSRANGSRWGGIRGYWKNELTQMTESKPALGEVKITPNELYVFVYVADKLLRNAPALEQFITRAATDEIAFKISDAIINGTGSGQPKGILAGTAGTDTCRIEVAKESGQAADTVVTNNILKMHARCHTRARANARWFVDSSVEELLPQLSMSVGTGGVPMYMPPGGLRDAPYATLLGKPVQVIEYAKFRGDVGDIVLADLKYYLLGTRGGVESAMSMHLKFDYNQTCFRFLFEADGQPWLDSAITPYTPTGGTSKSSNTTSPIVALAARA